MKEDKTMKYIKPQIEVITISSQATMTTVSIIGGDTEIQLGKYRNNENDFGGGVWEEF